MSYELVWFDEFTQDGPPDPSKWFYETGGDGFGNNELQYYTDRLENAYVKNGRLIIEARPEVFEHRGYTSAKLTTYQLKSFQYGKLLVKAKLPKGKGTWPAIWLLPNSIKKGRSWPRCGEIDLVEHVGKNQDQLHFSLHTEMYNHVKRTQYTHVDSFEGITERFVEYGLEWTPEYMAFLVDGKEVVRFVRGEGGKNIEEFGWPFDQEFYLILNLAVGGNWGGPLGEGVFPCKLEIDYVRYYQLVENM